MTSRRSSARTGGPWPPAGWTQMASVRAAKAAVIDALSFSPVVQPGVTGAALLAAFALDGEGAAARRLHPACRPSTRSAADRLLKE